MRNLKQENFDGIRTSITEIERVCELLRLTFCAHGNKIMETDEDYEIIETMEKYGGSFVKALAYAFRSADQNNFAKLKNTFPEYWEQYKAMSERQN